MLLDSNFAIGLARETFTPNPLLINNLPNKMTSHYFV